MKLIDRDALVAEIKKIIPSEPYPRTSDTLYGSRVYGKIEMCNEIISRINSLEEKEVDLDKEMDLVEDKYYGFESLSRADIIEIIKHFFEFGLKAQKGEIV